MGAFAVIEQRYLHVSLTPCYLDGGGDVWLESSWHRDFVAHLEYLKAFISCAPCLPWRPGLDLVRLEPEQASGVKFVRLPPQSSYLEAVLHLPRTIAALWRAVSRSDIVQSGVGGWPYPLGWIVNPIALFMGKKLVINVESDWKMTVRGRDALRHRVVNMDPVRHWMARWSCRRAHLTLFTQGFYRDSLCTELSGASFVTPAVWVNEGDILRPEVGELVWDSKMNEPARLLFAGRLATANGIDVLLAALRSLDAQRMEVRIDVVGDGERRNACLEAARSLRSVHLAVLDPVPYGIAFFELIRRYHAVLVPTVGDEQPRILFDASAQAVPVIATQTNGIRPYVRQGRTGWLVPVGEVAALGAAVQRARAALPELRRMGMTALLDHRVLTHRAMHRRRSHLIRAACT